jgi:hypothetical protein
MTEPELHVFFQYRAIIFGIASPPMYQADTATAAGIGLYHEAIYHGPGFLDRIAVQVEMPLHRIIPTVQALRQPLIHTGRHALHILIGILESEFSMPVDEILQIGEGAAVAARVWPERRGFTVLFHSTTRVRG